MEYIEEERLVSIKKNANNEQFLLSTKTIFFSLMKNHQGMFFYVTQLQSEIDWLWLTAADLFNKDDFSQVEDNLFAHDDPKSEELHDLIPDV